MNNILKTLENITYLKGNHALTFGVAHVFKAMQLMHAQKYVSRATLCQELNLGEGSVKTLISHLKKSKYSDSIKAGSYLLENGIEFMNNISKNIISEVQFDKDVSLSSQHGYVVLLKNISNNKINHEEHRFLAIKCGAITSLIAFFKNNKIVTNKQENSLLSPKIKRFILENMKPQENDLIMMSSASSKIVAEIATKLSVLHVIDKNTSESSVIL